MAKAEPAHDPAMHGYQRTVKRETPVVAFVQIILAIAVAGGVLFWYSQHVGKKKAVADLREKAAEAARGDDAPALLKAKSLYSQIPEHGVSIADDDRALVMMAELNAQLYQGYGMQDARADAQKWVNEAKAQDVKKAERFAAEAYLLIGDGQAQQAEQMLRELTDKRGVRHGKILHALSVAEYELGKYKQAQAAAEQGMKLMTGLARLPIAHGDAMLAQGNYGSARNAYKRALQINGNHLRARTAILYAQAVAGDGNPRLLHKEAAKLREEATTQTGGTPPPRSLAFIEFAEGEIFIREGEDKEALEQANKALETYPKLHAAHVLKGRALARLGKPAEAVVAFQEALKAAPTSVPYAQLASETLWRIKKSKQAVPLAKSVTDAAPKDGKAWVTLAIAQARAGDGKGATQSAEQAIKILGNAHELALFAKARALQASGSLDKARETYNEALGARQDPKWPEVYFEMGWVRFAEKNYEDATALFQEAVKLWEKGNGSLDQIADAMEAMADSIARTGKGRTAKKNRALADELREKAEKVRRGE